MTGNKRPRMTLLFFVLFFVTQLCCTPAAFAADPELQSLLPGAWHETHEPEEEGAAAGKLDMALTFHEDGTMALAFSREGSAEAYTYQGTWQLVFVPDYSDRLTLLFTSTDNPRYDGQEYRVECVYEAYTESWEENDTLITYLLLNPPISCSGVSPFEEMTGANDAALRREQGPNMKIVKCKDYVSLRQKPAKSAKRKAKVPLGASVLAFPEKGKENGFILCLYQGEYGYILADYLQPIP